MFEIVGAITAVETIAEGSGIRERPGLKRFTAKATERKRKDLPISLESWRNRPR
ncbi:MAG: hypothetical protein U0938_01190 [Thiobacillus sp.]|nr:hypothetical protein [Thiobacillus sp.]